MVTSRRTMTQCNRRVLRIGPSSSRPYGIGASEPIGVSLLAACSERVRPVAGTTTVRYVFAMCATMRGHGWWYV